MNRTAIREQAFKLIYSLEIQKQDNLQEAIDLFLENNEINDFIQTLKKYNIKKCYYGHLHGTAIKEAVEGIYFDIEFKLVSADAIGFCPVRYS